MPEDIEILTVDRAGAVALALEMGRVHAHAYNDAGYEEQPVELFRTKQLPVHAVRDDFRCVVARRASRTVGFGYGYTGQRGQRWSDWLAGQMPAALADEWIGGHFEVVELAVSPAERRVGVGGALHDALIAGLPHERALLRAYRGDATARRFLLRRGWMRLWAGNGAAAPLYGLRLTSPAAVDSIAGSDSGFPSPVA